MKIGDIVTAKQTITRPDTERFRVGTKKTRKVKGKVIQITKKLVTLQLKHYKESFFIEDVEE